VGIGGVLVGGGLWCREAPTVVLVFDADPLPFAVFTFFVADALGAEVGASEWWEWFEGFESAGSGGYGGDRCGGEGEPEGGGEDGGNAGRFEEFRPHGCYSFCVLIVSRISSESVEDPVHSVVGQLVVHTLECPFLPEMVADEVRCGYFGSRCILRVLRARLISWCLPHGDPVIPAVRAGRVAGFLVF